ncbi:hypothetical protein AAMO2058_000751100 [Amorphochlora amoebiformis]
MSAFRRATNLVKETEAKLTELEEKGLPAQGLGESDIDKWHAKAKELSSTLDEIDEKMAVFVAKAEEKDPDKKIYGAGMVKRVLALNERLSSLRPRLEPLLEAWGKAFEPISQKRLNDDQMAKQQELARAEAAEAAERMREAARRAREIAEAGRAKARLRREQEEKRRKELEEKTRLEKERIEYEEQKKRLKEEAERRQAAEKMKPEEVLKLIRDSNSFLQVSRVITTLKVLMGNIVNDPGEKTYRRIRKSNKHIQSELLQYKGGEEFLLSIGFRLRRILINTEGPTDKHPKAELREKLLTFYKTFAPNELPKVDIPRVVDFFAGGKETELWERLKKKYGKGEEDLPTNYKSDPKGQLFYVLDEPSVSSQNEWQTWFKNLKRARALLHAR